MSTHKRNTAMVSGFRIAAACAMSGQACRSLAADAESLSAFAGTITGYSGNITDGCAHQKRESGTDKAQHLAHGQVVRRHRRIPRQLRLAERPSPWALLRTRGGHASAAGPWTYFLNGSTSADSDIQRDGGPICGLRSAVTSTDTRGDVAGVASRRCCRWRHPRRRERPGRGERDKTPANEGSADRAISFEFTDIAVHCCRLWRCRAR